MDWDELHSKQFREVEKLKEGRDMALITLERRGTQQEITTFHSETKKSREDLYLRHIAEAEKQLDKREYKDKQLAYFKTMAKEYPDNEYWLEAVERMETLKKQKQLDKIRQQMNSGKGQGKEPEF